MRDQFYCYESLEHPLEENPGLEVGQIIVSNDQLDQLITSDKCQNDSCNWHDHIL